jgi:hypothetical protein
MKKIISIIGLLLSTTTFAITSMVIDGKKVDCQKIGTTEYKCKQDEKDILVKNTGYGFSGVLLKGDSFPKVLIVSEVLEDKKMIYGKSDGKSMMNKSFDDFNSESDSVSSRINSAKNLVQSWKASKVSEAKDLVTKLNEYIVKNSKERNKLTLIGENNQSYDCNRNPAKAKNESCNLFICTNTKGEKGISVIPQVGSYGNLYAFIPNKENPVVESNGIKVIDPSSKDDVPLFDSPKFEMEIPEARSDAATIVQSRNPIPNNFKGSKQTFNFLNDEMNSANIDFEAAKCSSTEELQKLLNDKKNLQDTIKDDLSKIELSHYLTVLNGQIMSVAIDAEKSKSMGCRYNGMILSESMLQHLNFLDKSLPKPVNKYLSVKEVQDLFKKAKLMNDIPFGYKYDGCYARAHVMARRFEALGVPVEKAWIKGNLSVPGTDIQWNYHVAPVINVKDENGNLVKYVIDPSLNDKAVPLDTWVNTMSHDVKGEVVKTPYPFPDNIAAFQRTAVAISSSDVFVPDNDEKRSESDNMKLAMRTMAEYRKVLSEEKSL